MDQTPPLDDTPQHSFSISSTPLTHLPTRKRKHDEILESCSSSPKFSSTFNDSLVNNFNDFRLEGSLPNTPEKQLKMVPKTVVWSPMEESRKILYSKIKVVKPERKFGVKNKRATSNNGQLLNAVLNDYVVMSTVFKYLSDGDLYRFSQVSNSFYRALETNRKAFDRYKGYRNIYRVNKENYVITPPGSPEKGDSPPRTDSEIFNKFIKTAKKLTRSQSLTKCQKCEGVAIVDNDISQCQNINSCGLIYCRLCSSFSETGPIDFHDRCGHAVLRPKLGNVSNRMEESFYSILNFSQQDSGFYSESESPLKVKRSLFRTPTEAPNALSVSNYNKTAVIHRKKEELSFVPVVAREQVRRQIISDSPPRYEYAVGSKQSKRNLKRLTR